ncbi:MAG: hypothetical protein DRJ69_01075 [Thermoprotei archaeon]|nr:MAG: hypothetical protein DRJ69_01075 [Thermoprotei archaeon]
MKRRLSKLARRMAFKEPRIAGVLLFGSHARGEAKPDSDLDLMILLDGRSQVNDVELYEQASKCFRWKYGLTVLSMEYGEFLSPQALTPTLLNVMWDAVVLYDRHGMLRARLRDLRRRICEAGLTRMKTGRAYYWRLPRPGAKVTL